MRASPHTPGPGQMNSGQNLSRAGLQRGAMQLLPRPDTQSWVREVYQVSKMGPEGGGRREELAHWGLGGVVRPRLAQGQRYQGSFLRADRELGPGRRGGVGRLELSRG